MFFFSSRKPETHCNSLFFLTPIYSQFMFHTLNIPRAHPFVSLSIVSALVWAISFHHVAIMLSKSACLAPISDFLIFILHTLAQCVFFFKDASLITLFLSSKFFGLPHLLDKIQTPSHASRGLQNRVSACLSKCLLLFLLHSSWALGLNWLWFWVLLGFWTFAWNTFLPLVLIFQDLAQGYLSYRPTSLVPFLSLEIRCSFSVQPWGM